MLDAAISVEPADTPPPMLPMDPHRGGNLTPIFGTFLCWLLGLEPMTSPATTGITITRDSVLASTTDRPFFDTHLGSVEYFEHNLRGWAKVCDADRPTVDGLRARMRSGGR